MQKNKYLLNHRLLLLFVILIISIVTTFTINRFNMRSDIHKQYFTTQTIKELQNLGIIVRSLEDLENHEKWVFNEATGLYKLDDYLIHPQVISEATYYAPMEVVNWRYPEITGSDGYYWVLENRIKPLVEGLEELYYQYPQNIELLSFFESALHKANVLIAIFGEQYDDDLTQTKIWLSERDVIQNYTEENGWEEVHPGVWHREIVINDKESRHSWHRETLEAQIWYVENILKPRYDQATVDLAEMGEEEAKRQGVYDEISSVISLYEANLEAIDTVRQEESLQD